MYSYPQRPGAAAGPPASAFAQPGLQSHSLHSQPSPDLPGVYVPPPPPLHSTSTLSSVPSGSVTTLRLKPSEDIRIEPPVSVSLALLPASAGGPQSFPALDLSLERQLLEQGGGEGRGSSGGGSGGGRAAADDVDRFLSGLKDGRVPLEPAVQQVADTGLEPAAAALGTAYVRAGRGGADQAADFASKVEQLTNMGFSLSIAAGALAKHKNDLEAATDSCLGIAS